jgi:hypothetical protein
MTISCASLVSKESFSLLPLKFGGFEKSPVPDFITILVRDDSPIPEPLAGAGGISPLVPRVQLLSSDNSIWESITPVLPEISIDINVQISRLHLVMNHYLHEVADKNLFKALLREVEIYTASLKGARSFEKKMDWNDFYLINLVYFPESILDRLALHFQSDKNEIEIKAFRDLPVKALFYKKMIDLGLLSPEMIASYPQESSLKAVKYALEKKEYEHFCIFTADNSTTDVMHLLEDFKKDLEEEPLKKFLSQMIPLSCFLNRAYGQKKLADKIKEWVKVVKFFSKV